VQEELDLKGISHIGGPADADRKVELTPGMLLEHDHDVGAVVVGFDRNINYYKIQMGAHLRLGNVGGGGEGGTEAQGQQCVDGGFHVTAWCGCGCGCGCVWGRGGGGAAVCRCRVLD
jgi:hypothetical protein